MRNNTLFNYIFSVFVICFLSFGYSSERAVSTSVPRGWNPSLSHTRSSLGEYEIQVTIALTQRNVKELESTFWAVSDPANINYGKYKTQQEIVDMIAPSQSSIDHVTSYFIERGIHANKMKLNPSRDFMNVWMSVAQAEDIFQTSYDPYVHAKTGTVAVGMRREGYTLHHSINQKIDFISRFSKIEAPVGEHAAAPREARTERNSVRAPSNAPLVKPWADSYGVYLELIVVCPDGSAPTILGNTTLKTVALNCGAVNFSSINVSLVSQKTGAIWFKGAADIIQDDFEKCSDAGDDCVPFAQVNNYPPDAVLYEPYIDTTNSTTFQIPLYVPYVVQVFVTYSDGTTSSVGNSTIVEGSNIGSPRFVSDYYFVPPNTRVQQANNNQSVVQYEGQSYNPDDLKTFFSTYGIADYSNLVQKVHPENNDPENPGYEAELDIQTIMGIAQNCTTIFWANNNTGSTIDMHLEWITDVLNQPTSPLVFSVSYGNSETHDYSVDYVNRTNIEFMKAGVRGITLIYSAGDDGAFSGGSNGVFDPSFPASSPYITCVGGTQYYSFSDPDCFNLDNYTCLPDEVVCSIANGAGITGGGGFSDIFPRPSYQDNVVNGYLSKISTTGFNASNRAYPDISMLAHNAPEVYQGYLVLLDGTSASAPYFAGMVTLLNDIRLSGGNAPLGFLNPFIYSLDSDAFSDITRGNNNCSHTACYPIGYEAITGFDAASGLGTPVFSEWATAVRNLPPSSTTSTSSSTTSSSSSTSPTSTSTSLSPSSSTTSTSGAAGSSDASHLLVTSTFLIFLPLLTLVLLSL